MSTLGTVRASGDLQAAADNVALDCAGQGSVAIQLAGTWVGTLVFEVSLTKDTWVALNVTAPNGTSTVTGATENGLWVGSVAGMQAIRVRCSAFTSGQIGVLLQAVAVGGGASGSGGSGGGGAVTIADGADVTQGAIADTKVTGDNAGTVEAKLRGLSYLWALVIDTANSWLKVSIQNASLAVTGTFWQATQPVSAASLPLPTGASAKVALAIAAIQATASGDTSLIASGTRKLKRVEASNSHATTALTVGLKVPSLNSGAVFGKKYLPAAGGLGVWVFPDDYVPVTSEVVSVNLSGTGQIEVTAYYE